LFDLLYYSLNITSPTKKITIMRKLKITMVALGVTFCVSSCSLTEDGIVPQKEVLRSKDGIMIPEPQPIPPPPPDILY
jgi:hypothetical protein